MRTVYLTCLACVTMILSPVHLLAEEGKVPDRAKAVIKAYEERLKKLQQDTVRLLEAELQTAMRMRDLDGANAIKAKQQELAALADGDAANDKATPQAPTTAGPDADLDAFIAQVTGKTWKLNGTENLKLIHFDGKAIRGGKDDRITGGGYPTTVHAPGVISIRQGTEHNQTWFIISPDLEKCVWGHTDVTGDGELVEDAKQP